MNEQEEARAELKIRRIANGWLLKGRDGWTAHGTIAELLKAIEELLLADKDGQARFFNSRWPQS